MGDTKVVDEFKTKTREYKPPYQTEERADGTKIIKVDTKRKLTPRDREMIKAFELAGYKRIHKRKDITKADMIKYVKENYDQQELEILNNKLNTINEENEENRKKITFATIKSWFKERYVYYPKGLDWNFGNTTSAKEKKERFIKVFNEHKIELKKDWKVTESQDNEHTEDKEKGKNHKNK